MRELLTEWIIYTDGACLRNPGGPGGWAAILIHRQTRKIQEISGGEASTTNNRMELLAAIRALEELPGVNQRVHVFSDSQYVINSASLWIADWKLTGKWDREGRVKNKDLMEMLDALTGKHLVTWEWVKGHSGNRGNERADWLAAQAAWASAQ